MGCSGHYIGLTNTQETVPDTYRMPFFPVRLEAVVQRLEYRWVMLPLTS
jgi:hypothetical protein